MSVAIARKYNFANDSAAGTPISSAKVDAELDQLIASLNQKVQIKSTAPATPADGQTWIDLSQNPPVMKIYDQTAGAWTNVTLPAFAGYDAKTAPVGADVMVINDSEDSAAPKKMTLTNLAKVITVLPDGVANTTDAAPDADKELANKKYVDGKFPTNSITAVVGNKVDKSGGYAAQQATTDCFIKAFADLSNGQYIYAYTDGNADPVFIQDKCKASTDGAAGTIGSVSMLVKKNDYWKIVTTGSNAVVSLIPIGS